MKNLIAFFEIPASDFRRAVAFYEKVLDTTLSVSECEEEKMACFMEQGEATGAVFSAPGYSPSADGVLIHFYSDDLENTLDKVVRNGGKVVMPPTKIEAEGKGSFAVFADTEGNRIGIYCGN